MTALHLERLALPAAALGEASPLPPLASLSSLQAGAVLGDGIPEEIARRARYGRPPDLLPYAVQDGYGRDLAPRELTVAVLENDRLRATFLLDHGGRLWSLVHRGRELLHSTARLQFANLALRNAWFAGGVEWNIGTIGHSPLTCGPVFAARVDGPGGQPALRLYEWERIRDVPFQLDFLLPDGSDVLLVHVRIRNPHPHEIPMYWWSNAAVPEEEGTRVLAPADAAYRYDYERLERVSVPGGIDSHPFRSPASADAFLELRPGARPWIAALGGDGTGLVQASTAALPGRKLFTWGSGSGGARWQEWLGGPGARYLEIQAGLARTQLEHVPMPAGAQWSWVEAYGPLRADAATVHGADWQAATDAVERALDRLAPAAGLEAALAEWRGAGLPGAASSAAGAAAPEAPGWADRSPTEQLHRGSGWGALERRRRAAAGEPAAHGPELVFGDDSLGDEQRPWIELLDRGRLPPARGPARPPGVPVVGARWRALLEDAGEPDWRAWHHLGVMRWHDGDRAAAREAWTRSHAATPNAWALRNLAIADARPAEAADRLVAALELAPDCRALLIETLDALLAADRPRDCLALAERHLRAHGRVRLAAARARLGLGDRGGAERLLAEGIVVDDLREGETALHDVWCAVHGRDRPLPARYDFRMRPD